ncbi:radical SAM protein [candidate division KSB1 bacterium]|nr:radical SAM protein [candidate division KSB1 bacterium]
MAIDATFSFPIKNRRLPVDFRCLMQQGVYCGSRNPLRIIPISETSGGTAFLQVNIGCRHNQCIFCNFYKDVRFREKSEAIILRDIDTLAEYFMNQEYSQISRLMLLDADGLDIGHDQLLHILEYARSKFPVSDATNDYVTGYDEKYEQFFEHLQSAGCRALEFSSFTHTDTIISKGVAQMRELKTLGLDFIWWGLESADVELLKLIRKTRNNHADSDNEQRKLYQAAGILEKADIFYVPIILVGLGGERFFRQHVTRTIAFLEHIMPPGFSLSDLVVPDGTGYQRLIQKGSLDLLSAARLSEQRQLFENMNITSPQFDYEV